MLVVTELTYFPLPGHSHHHMPLILGKSILWGKGFGLVPGIIINVIQTYIFHKSRKYETIAHPTCSMYRKERTSSTGTHVFLKLKNARTKSYTPSFVMRIACLAESSSGVMPRENYLTRISKITTHGCEFPSINKHEQINGTLHHWNR